MRLQIADWFLDIVCDAAVLEYLPNLKPFVVSEESDVPVICRLHTACVLQPELSDPVLVQSLEERRLSLWLTSDSCFISLAFAASGHTYHLRADRSWEHITTDCRSDNIESVLALGDFIMLSFTLRSAFFHTVLIHASCVYTDQGGCAFVGPSGVGKSTHSQLWLQYISGCRLLNDDQPVLRKLSDGSVRIYGSPWSGKTICYRQESVPLRALFFLKQASENRLVVLNGIDAFQRLLGATSLVGRDAESFAMITETIAHIVGTVPACLFENVPERAAVEQSFRFFQSS